MAGPEQGGDASDPDSDATDATPDWPGWLEPLVTVRFPGLGSVPVRQQDLRPPRAREGQPAVYCGPARPVSGRVLLAGERGTVVVVRALDATSQHPSPVVDEWERWTRGWWQGRPDRAQVADARDARGRKPSRAPPAADCRSARRRHSEPRVDFSDGTKAEDGRFRARQWRPTTPTPAPSSPSPSQGAPGGLLQALRALPRRLLGARALPALVSVAPAIEA